MTKNTLESQIIADLGANYRNDTTVLEALLDDAINDALIVSKRKQFVGANDTGLETQLDILASNIRKCVKSMYLVRGAEEMKSQSQSGINATYDNALETMRHDIIYGGKRVLM